MNVSTNNQVRLVGNLGKDVEVITFDSGNKLAKFSIATNEYYKNKEGEKVTNTQWHNVIGWGGMADRMSLLLQKGTPVLVDGKLTYRSYKDNDGNMRYVSEVVATGFNKLGKKEEEKAPF